MDGVRDGRRFGEIHTLPCLDCAGTGTITEEHWDRIVAGEALRADRKVRGLSLLQEAQRLGIDVRVLGNRERGRE